MVLIARGSQRSNCSRLLVESVCIAVLYSVGYVLSSTYHLYAFLWMLAGCIAVFAYYSIRARNLLDLRAILCASITGSIAVCQLRMADFQMVWGLKTWICHGLTLICFCLGYGLVKIYANSLVGKFTNIKNKIYTKGKIKFGLNPKKVYYAAIFLAIMPVVLFCIQVYIKGFIPIFEQRYDAYTRFYTRLSIFINLVMFSAPLAYWCLKNMKLSRWQKVLMWAIIPLPSIIFQLMVQRGLFIWSICIFLVMTFFESDHKFLAVVLCGALLVFGVFFSSAMRGLTSIDMSKIWQIHGEIVLDNPSSTTTPTVATTTSPPATEPPVTSPPATEPPVTTPNTDPTTPTTKPSDPPSDSGQKTTIVLPGFLYAPYYYVTNGMENFNNMVMNLDEHAWGLRQLTPFTVVLRFPALRERIANLPEYELLENGSAGSICGDFYYDFGFIGVFIEMLLVGVVCAVVSVFTKRHDLFATLEYGVLFAVTLTAFFTPWFTQFGTWLFAGTAFLIFLFVYFSRTKKREKEVNEPA